MRVYVRRRQSGFFAKLKAVSGVVPVPGAVRRSQFLAALAAMTPNSIETLAEAISPDRDDATNIEFNTATFVIYGDLLAAKTQSVFGFSNAQMATLFANAGALLN